MTGYCGALPNQTGKQARNHMLRCVEKSGTLSLPLSLALSFALTLIATLPVISSDAAAQDISTSPRYFKVEGVASDDVLNARANPDSSAAIVGSFAHNASPVEVFREQNGWAQVTLDEQMGWVSMRFLKEATVSTIGKSTLPEGLSCGGTEPFWGLTISGGQIRYSNMDHSEQAYAISDADQFHHLGSSTNFVLAQGNGEQLTAVISNQMCSDGMSDRDYPRRIDLLSTKTGQTIGQSGCCNLPLAR
jgi:uncharacterized membrane protein